MPSASPAVPSLASHPSHLCSGPGHAATKESEAAVAMSYLVLIELGDVVAVLLVVEKDVVEETGQSFGMVLTDEPE